jgi:hypothetical protein
LLVNEEPLQKDSEIEKTKQPEEPEVIVIPGYVNQGLIPIEPDLGRDFCKILLGVNTTIY